MKYKHISAFFPIVFSVLAFFLSCAGGANPVSPAMAEPVPFMANAKKGVLPSGLTYYLLENSRPEGRVFLTLAVNAGSVLETEEERGLAHFVEHMAFNGTARFKKSELVNYLRDLGMRFGPEVNAYTSFDSTVYGIEVPVETAPDGRKTIPSRALEVIDDWTWSVTFDEKDIENERLVILEEYRSRLGAEERINREMYPLLFRGSPYAERLPIGLPEVIENAPAERLVHFYKKWYRPENMAVIIAGDFDAAYLETRLAEYFPVHETSSREKFTRPNYDLAAPKKGSVEALVLTDSELAESRIELYWKREAEAPRGDLAYYRDGVIDNLAYTMLSLRFQEEAVKSETPYVWAAAGSFNFAHSSRFYVLAAQAKTNSVKAAAEELLLAKESLSRYGFSEYELEAAKASLLSSMETLVEEEDRQPSNYYVGAFTRHFLEGETVPDLSWELDAVKKLLPEISLEEVNRAAKNYFSDDDLTAIITAPEAEKTGLPQGADVRNMAASAREAEIAPPRAVQPRSELLSEVPAPGAIVSDVTDAETGALRWKLGNGAELILKETKNKNNEISLYALAWGGTLSAPDKDAVSAALAAEMLNVSGLGSFSLPELTRALLDKQAALSFWTYHSLRGFEGSAALKDAKTLFEMLYLSFTQPRFDAEAVKAMLDQRRTSLAFEENSPDAVFNREVMRTMYGNPRFHPLVLADLDKADPGAALEFIKRCLNPADYTFVIAGNLDIPLFRSLAETYLASIPRTEPFGGWTDADPMRPAGVTEKEVRKGKEARSTVSMQWFVPEPYSEEKNAAVSVLHEYLDIQLTEEIRETLGGVYSIYPWFSLSPFLRGELSGNVYFVCDPKRAGELAAAVKEEFAKIARGEIDGSVFQKAAEALIKDHEQLIQSNRTIAQSYANSVQIYRMPLGRQDKKPALYRAVSPEDIQKTAGDLLAGSYAEVILNPES